jgi:hypothetical protein
MHLRGVHGLQQTLGAPTTLNKTYGFSLVVTIRYQGRGGWGSSPG